MLAQHPVLVYRELGEEREKILNVIVGDIKICEGFACKIKSTAALKNSSWTKQGILNDILSVLLPANDY